MGCPSWKGTPFLRVLSLGFWVQGDYCLVLGGSFGLVLSGTFA
jgi:hypothetical protein